MGALTFFADEMRRQGRHPPCFAFSVHKAGSSLMNGMIKAVCERAGIPALSVPDFLFERGLRERDWHEDKSLLPLFTSNFVFYGFRELPRVLLEPGIRLDARKCVLLRRDPRDSLVSQYFSFGKNASHVRPGADQATFLKSLHTGDDAIDDYVLQFAPTLKTKLTDYQRELAGSNVATFRYEEIYFDKFGFIKAIFDQFGIPVAESILREVATDSDIRPVEEDPRNHIRKGTPGDFRVKLKPETICALNEIFF